MADFKEILQEDSEPISNDEVLRYLDGKTTNAQRNAFEKKLSNACFESDAIEGLQQMKTQKLHKQVTHLKKHLSKQLRSKKGNKKINYFNWLVLAIIIILFLCAVSYVVIVML